MLQALRERRCVEDAQENAWKTRAKIWVDAQVGSEACLVRNQAEAENGNWIEIHFENSATQTWKTDHSRTYCCFKSRAPHDRPADLVSRSKRQFIPALLQHPRGWPTLFFTGNHRNFGLLTSSTSNRWNQIFLSWTKRSITKSTRRAWDSGSEPGTLSRMVSAVPWRSSSSQQAEAKERTLSEQSSLPERECFSDEDLDEENPDYEEIVIPKKKQAKRKLRANEAASSKRIKSNPNPQLRVLKKSPKKRLGPPPGAPPSKRLRPKPSSILSRR